MLADELESYYFPSAHRERAEGRQFKAAIYRAMIERFAKEEGISLAKAKERVVAFYDLEFCYRPGAVPAASKARAQKG